MATPTPLNSEGYNTLNDSITAIIMAGKYALVTIYTDAAGTTIAVDEHGPIDKRIVLSISFTASYKDADGNDTNPFVTIKFKDTAGMISAKFIDYFTSVDYVDDHWYILDSMPVPKRKF